MGGYKLMNPNVLVAAINAGGSIVIGVTALILAYRGLNSIERRLEVIEGDLKQFYRDLSGSRQAGIEAGR
jgi:hypothetical protein